MTEEFGQRNTSLSPFEQVAATSTKYLIAAVNAFVGEQSLRFDDTTATLSISGTSTTAGEGFARGRLATLMLVCNAMLPVGLLQFLDSPPLASDSLLMAAYALVVLLPIALFGILNAYGSMTLVTKTNVIDHTTEPTPETDDLVQQYVDGEIESVDELEAQAEARFE